VHGAIQIYYTGNSLQRSFGGPVTSLHYSEVHFILKWG